MVNMDLDCAMLLDKATTEALILRSMAHPHILPMYTCFLAGPPSSSPSAPPQQLAAANSTPVFDTAHAAESAPGLPPQPGTFRQDKPPNDTAHEHSRDQPEQPLQQQEPSLPEQAAAGLAERANSHAQATTTANAQPAGTAAGFDFDALPGQQTKCWLWMVLPCMEASLLDVLHTSHPEVNRVLTAHGVALTVSSPCCDRA